MTAAVGVIECAICRSKVPVMPGDEGIDHLCAACIAESIEAIHYASGFDPWFNSEGQRMVDGGCSHDTIARAAWFVATNASAERAMRVIDEFKKIAKGAEKKISPWQPIETAPTDRTILAWDEDYGVVVCRWVIPLFGRAHWLPTGVDSEIEWLIAPSHWQEIPSPPVPKEITSVLD